MRNQKLRVLRDAEFQAKNFLNLQQVELTRCNINSIHDLAFTNLTNLVRLDLSGNRLTRVPTPIFVTVPQVFENFHDNIIDYHCMLNP